MSFSFLSEARAGCLLICCGGRYHHLNHWVLFGGGYRGGAMRIIKVLIAEYGEGSES